MKYIYIDSLFFLSLFTDYLLCLITARICRLCLRRRRYLAAALLGAAYSVSVFLPDLSFMASRWMELVSAALMGLIAFGGERRMFRCMAVFLAVSATFGGAIWALSLQTGALPVIDLRLKRKSPLPIFLTHFSWIVFVYIIANSSEIIRNIL